MRWLLVAGALGILLSLLTAGCTHVSADAPRNDLEISVKPWVRPVKWVAHRPARAVFVGRVKGAATDEEFVSAAARVHAALDARARALGADVVKIDRVIAGARIVVAGRAYRLAD
jgi:hypothetical protein